MRVVPSKRPKARTAERVDTEYIPLLGGEDLVSPALSINPGALMFSENYEPGLVYGYRRVDGFERTDGRPAPSDASYWALNYDALGTGFTVGETVTGTTSTASGEIVAGFSPRSRTGSARTRSMPRTARSGTRRTWRAGSPARGLSAAAARIIAINNSY